MDKNRLLDQVGFFRISLILGIILLVPVWWWRYSYIPLLQRISSTYQAYKHARSIIAKEKEIEESLLSEKLAYTQLLLKKRSLLGARGFTRNQISKEIITVVNASKLTILFFRTSPWRKKEDVESCIIEIGVRGSFAQCCSFLENMKTFGAKLKSSIIEANEDDLKLTGEFKVVAGDSSLEKPDLCDPKIFSQLRDIFSSNQKIAKKKPLISSNQNISPAISSTLLGDKLPFIEIDNDLIIEMERTPRPIKPRINRNDVVV